MEWITSGHPESEDIWCVIWVRDDYEFAYWVEGTDYWDCPDVGWIESEEVKGWLPLPEGL